MRMLSAALAATLLASPALAQSQVPAGDAARGAGAYETACLRCHETPAVLMRRVAGSTAAEKAAVLHEFLASHHARDAQIRADIVAFLLDAEGAP